MAVIVSDIVAYCAASRPDDDTSTVGGAIDTAARPLDNQLSATSVIAAVSDGSDTRTLTVEGRAGGGGIATEKIILNGTTESVGMTGFTSITSLTLDSADASRLVAVRQGSGGTTIHVLNPNETQAVQQFRKSVAAAAAKDYYEKYFLKNTNLTDSYKSVDVDNPTDPSGLYTMGLGVVDGSSSVTNRTTDPGVSFSDGPATLPGDTNLDAGEAIELWLKEALGADEAAGTETFDIRTDGTT